LAAADQTLCIHFVQIKADVVMVKRLTLDFVLGNVAHDLNTIEGLDLGKNGVNDDIAMLGGIFEGHSSHRIIPFVSNSVMMNTVYHNQDRMSRVNTKPVEVI
jgi:hypothetical protein